MQLKSGIGLGGNHGCVQLYVQPLDTWRSDTGSIPGNGRSQEAHVSIISIFRQLKIYSEISRYQTAKACEVVEIREAPLDCLPILPNPCL